MNKHRVLIQIPPPDDEDGCIELLGYKINGYRDLESFLERLSRLAELEEENKELRKMLGLESPEELL